MARMILGPLAIMLAIIPWLAVSGGAALAQQAKEAAPDPVSQRNFFEIDPLNIPVIRGSRIRGQITFIVVLELKDGVDRSDIFDSMPRLRHAFFLDLKEYVERHRNIMRDVRLGGVKSLLMESSAQVLGDGTVRAVLVQSASIHRF